jgi:putative membrane protein
MTVRAVAVNVIAGLLGGLLGAGVMSAVHSLVSGGQPNASSAAQGEDATVKVGDAFSRILRGRPLDEGEKPTAGSVVHYGFGASMGALYGIVSAASPVATVGRGTGFGAAVWLGAHVIVVPALGLAPFPLQQPLRKEGLELVLHLLFGAIVDLVRRGALRIAR